MKRLALIAAAVGLTFALGAAPASAETKVQGGVITYVAYFSDATYSNLVGGTTYSQCPGDPSYHWGAYTAYHTTYTEPCP